MLGWEESGLFEREPATRFWTLAAALLLLATAALDLVIPTRFDVLSGYPLAVLLVSFARDRRELGAMAATALLLLSVKPALDGLPPIFLEPRLIERLAAAGLVLLGGFVANQWILARDATDDRRAELIAELRGQRRRFETVFRTLPIAILACDDAECTEVSGNPAAAALFGAPLDTNYSPFQAQGAGPLAAFQRDGRSIAPSDLPLVRAALRGEEIKGEEIELELPGARLGCVMVGAVPLFDSNGNRRGAVCAIVDITAQKELQRALDSRRRESEEANTRKTRFLAAVSHDIRTPANAIRLQADLIRRSASDPSLADRVPDLAERLDRNATALVELVGEVLDLTRIDGDKLDLQESEFSLGEAILEECRHFTPIAEKKGLELVCEAVDPPIRMRADRVKVGRVLGNLVENGIKFTDAGAVYVSARALDDGVEISVRDTGAGIPADEQVRIFDEFFQLRNPERDAAKGRGLGLAICNRLVEAMAGTIRLESEPGSGSTFTVWLPRQPKMMSPVAAPVYEPLDASVGLQPRVLIVEDHADTRHATAELLRAEAIDVVEAADVATALDLLERASPDVVLLDLMLPDRDGIEILERLRTNRPPRLRGLIVATGDLATRSRSQILDHGADIVLDKPLDPSALIDAIRTAIGGGMSE